MELDNGTWRDENRTWIGLWNVVLYLYAMNNHTSWIINHKDEEADVVKGHCVQMMWPLKEQSDLQHGG